MRSPRLELDALTLFAEALDQNEAERDDWLAARCGSDTELLTRVRELLVADAASSPTLDRGPVASESDLLPPTQVGIYHLAELIGAGGMGSVYRAQRNDGLFEQAVAIKFIRPLHGLAEPLVDAERKLLARMEHPGIARILDGGLTPNGLHFLVMEFVSGQALDQYVQERALTIRQRVMLLREVCAAVAHAHQNLVVHCDIKPANILVTQEGRPKLLDFGVARIQDAIDSRPQGFTRAYTSPQRLAGEQAVVSDDVYSLGVVLHELITGSLPETPSSARPLRGELAAIVRKAMAFDVANRYASVAAFDEDLLRWLECKPVEAVGHDWRYRARKLVQRRPWRVAAAALATAGLLAGLAVITTLYSRADTARKEAERRFSEVRSLANYMLFDLDKRLETTPGTTQARREMVGRSQQYLDALGETAGDNPSLQREVAVGLARLAEVQGVPGKAHVGDPAAAKGNLERAERILVKLTTQHPHHADWLRDLGRVRYLLALVYGGANADLDRQLQKAEEAEKNLVAAIDATPQWKPALREIGEAHVLLTSARLTQADVYRNREQHERAAKIQQQEEKRLLALPESLRTPVEFDYHSGRPAVLLGDSLYYLGRYDEALAAYRRGVQRFERGLATSPRHRRLLEALVIAYWSISGTLGDTGHPRDALPPADRAAQIADRLLELDPDNLEASRLRMTAQGQRAIVLANLGRYDEAIRLLEQNTVEKIERARLAPEDAERARDIAVPLRNIAAIYRDKGDVAGSCRVLRQAVDTWTRLDRRWGLSEYDRKNELGVVQSQLARCP